MSPYYESGASDANATLPDSDLSIENGKLVERFKSEIVDSYAYRYQY